MPQAVTVRVQKEEDGFMAVFDELNLHGFGSSVSEAVERLAEATVEYWLHLRDDADIRAVPPCREHYRFLRDQLRERSCARSYPWQDTHGHRA